MWLGNLSGSHTKHVPLPSSFLLKTVFLIYHEAMYYSSKKILPSDVQTANQEMLFYQIKHFSKVEEYHDFFKIRV